MAIQHVHTFVVHPKKGKDDPGQVNGAAVRMSGKMFELLKSIYEKSDQECDVGITFLPAAGVQQNECRDLIVAYLDDPNIANGRALATRLELHTDGRSGMGLLFLIAGKEGADHKIVISRFPTDHAIYVDEDPGKFAVEFLERVFMKNKTSYKAVNYRDTSLRNGIWNGNAIDRQINTSSIEVSNYWIADFLASQMTTTAAAGTKRLAVAVRNAAQKAGLDIKQEIIAAATLAPGLGGQRTSINDFANRYNLSDAAKAAISSELRNPRLAQESFLFDAAEFRKLVAFKAVELSNGVTLTAPSNTFEDVVRQHDAPNGEVRFETQGTIVNERLKSQV
jgi:hypothetical protein